MHQELHNMSTAEKTYMRVTTGGEVGAKASLPMPEASTHRFESSLSDFLSPGYLVKRIFDVTVSFIVLVLSLPLLGLIAFAIRCGSRGPVFHNVFRTGMGFRVFKLYGFRTTKAGAQRMVENICHICGPLGSNDMKLHAQTTLGRILNATGLDMLPMFYNVLIGDLSLVGNRALPLQEASKLVNDECCERFVAPAGIWGLHGLNEGRHRAQDHEEMIAAELDYARRGNFLLDLRIIMKAVMDVLRNAFRRTNVRTAVTPLPEWSVMVREA